MNRKMQAIARAKFDLTLYLSTGFILPRIERAYTDESWANS
jgi:hypothetical protein